jgi:hypothetical protein
MARTKRWPRERIAKPLCVKGLSVGASKRALSGGRSVGVGSGSDLAEEPAVRVWSRSRWPWSRSRLSSRAL